MMTRLLFSSQRQRRSLDFEFSSSQYLSMTAANFGAYNLDKLSFSMWYKRESTSGGINKYLLAQGTGSATDAFQILFNPLDKLEFYACDGTSTNHGFLQTTATFTNTTAWHHLLLWFDRNNATANDRMRIWHDGTEITSFSGRTNPTNAMNNSSTLVTVGGGQPFDGKLFQVCMFSNQLTSISDVYDNGRPKNVKLLPGLHFLLDTNVRDDLEDDYVLATNWTNNGGVTKSRDVI